MWKSFAWVLLLLTGCSTFRPLVFVRMDTSALPEGRSDTVAVSYADSIFQERFMSVGGIVGHVLFTGPVDVVTLGQVGATSALNTAVYTPRARTELRHKESEYERVLGDLDVHADFNEALTESLSGAAGLDAELAVDPTTNGAVIDVLRDPSFRDCTQDPVVLGGDLRERLSETGAAYVLGLKFSYGLGARQGREQMGFNKNYRPFVKLVGALIDTVSGEIRWRNFLIAFSEKAYRGSKANAENLDGPALAGQFRVINRQLAAALVDCLNGEPAPDQEMLVGLSTELDLSF